MRFSIEVIFTMTQSTGQKERPTNSEKFFSDIEYIVYHVSECRLRLYIRIHDVVGIFLFPLEQRYAMIILLDHLKVTHNDKICPNKWSIEGLPYGSSSRVEMSVANRASDDLMVPEFSWIEEIINLSFHGIFCYFIHEPRETRGLILSTRETV